MFTQEDAVILTAADSCVAHFDWNQISSEVSCARKTINSCPACRGFLFDAVSGLCVPLIWLHQRPGAASVLPPAGQLFFTDVCPKGFQVAVYGNRTQLACVKMITPATTYGHATSVCIDSGGHLASMKTVEKLAMVDSLALGRQLWIGLDDQVDEGVYIWQEDGSQLTDIEMADLFDDNEPNNWRGREDCVHFRGNRGRLNDEPCWSKKIGLCEMSPPPQTNC
ncbi:C-type lectin-related protein 4 [Plakobranchus ocellatus]|uniref:C-type lectin-related protein 4 n=1 Tax=Plakobranchus ocellatus TaxID=259542 RepID=A0AAV4CK18_9GAST|nr:C-type lectin-related protein 4 [Plakobranchus ocellatus]